MIIWQKLVKAFYRKVKEEGQHLEIEIGRYDNGKFSSTYISKKMDPGRSVVGDADGSEKVFGNIPDEVVPEEGIEINYHGKKYYIKPINPIGYASPSEKIFHVNKIRKEFKTIP